MWWQRQRAPAGDLATARRPADPGHHAAPRREVDLRDEHVLRAVYQEHAGELFRFAHRQLGDAGAAEDVVQEAFLRAWRSAADFDPRRSALRTWLFTITGNLVIDAARRRGARPSAPVPTELLVAMTGSDHGFEDGRVTAWTVEEALRRINPEHRTALVETYLRGRSYAEVSAEIGVPVGTLRSRVFYGLKALRLVMDEMGVQP